MDALTRAAVAGTSRETPPAEAFPTDDLFANATDASQEKNLLLRAGARAVYRAAGRVTEAGVEPSPSAPDETIPACSAKAAEILRSLLTRRDGAILPEALDRLRLAGLRLPHALLPATLNVDRKELRPAVVAVLGERGRWLAGFNPDWSWVSGRTEDPDETIWEEGSLDERITALRRIRLEDAASGRHWVEGVWKSEKAEARTAMVAALESGLSPDDETFLERALDDRSVRVREAAATLLVRLPGSAYVGRATKRADRILVGYEPPGRSLIRRRRAGRITGTPPEEVDDAWKRDLPGDKPARGVGEKAWRISRSLSVVPPQHWERRFGAEPSELVAAARGDWESSLLTGWCRAAILHENRDWTMPLWERCYGLPDDPEGRQVWLAAQELAPLLPQDRLARALPGLLAGRSFQIGERFVSTLQTIPPAWTPELSKVYVECLHAHLRMVVASPQPGGGGWWTQTLSHAAVALSPEFLGAATGIENILRGSKGQEDWLPSWVISELRKFDETLELRRRLVKEIPL